LDDVKAFFTTYYTPRNAVLSIAGDLDPGEARAFVDRHFGRIPPGEAPPPLPDMTVPPTFGAWKRTVVPDDGRLPRLMVGFRSPTFGSQGYHAAHVCAAVLGMRRGSRLHRNLVREKQVASDAQAFTFDLSIGADLFVVDVTARPGVAPELLEKEVAFELDRLFTDGVSADEVDRAVALIQTDFVRAMQSAGDRADRMSQFATYFGDPSLVNAQPQRYRAVTAAEVNAFAHERLGEDNRASLLFVPREDEPVAVGEEARP
jgi:predicted Zn-dependent peptidase